MDLLNKRILFVDLEKGHSEVKSFPDYKKYMGGFGLAVKILSQYKSLDPIIFAVGPLSGIFPFASKTAVVFKDNNEIKDVYLGGHLASRIKFSDLDAVVLYNKASVDTAINMVNSEVEFINQLENFDNLGLPGKRVSIRTDNKRILVDHYFSEPENFLYKKFISKRLYGIVITGTNIYQVPHIEKYTEIYTSLLKKHTQLTVEQAFFPSCSGCPMGCEKSKNGEMGGNVLLHSLVSCGYAEKIFTDAGTIFSCLNSLGYDYTHEDIEAIPNLVKIALSEIEQK